MKNTILGPLLPPVFLYIRQQYKQNKPIPVREETLSVVLSHSVRFNSRQRHFLEPHLTLFYFTELFKVMITQTLMT